MKFKRHESVEAMLEHSLSDSKATIDAMNQMFNEDAVSRNLFILRAKAGVSQAEMAKRLKVSQSVISRMENDGNYLKFNDVIRFINALGYSAEMACVPDGRSVDFLASYFFRIKKEMKLLQKLAANDPDINKGVMTMFLKFSKSMLEDVIPQIKDQKPGRQLQLDFSLNPEEPETDPDTSGQQGKMKRRAKATV